VKQNKKNVLVKSLRWSNQDFVTCGGGTICTFCPYFLHLISICHNIHITYIFSFLTGTFHQAPPLVTPSCGIHSDCSSIGTYTTESVTHGLCNAKLMGYIPETFCVLSPLGRGKPGKILGLVWRCTGPASQ